MFVGRKKELAELTADSKKSGIPVVVLYGREGVGKTTLAREFARERNCVYYLGRELSKEEQKRYFQEVLEQVAELVNKAVRAALSATATEAAKATKAAEKICFIVDEFDVMEKAYKDFFAELDAYVSESAWEDRVMLLLISSSTQWVENQMVDDMGTFAARVVQVMKLKEFTFLEMVNRFPGSTTEECITIYSILGGVPGYLDLWNPSETVKENIIRLMLLPGGPLRKEAARFLKTSLRELPFYNTILSVLAEDEPKLNYLYNRTGFSRAKISVYIKNLIQIDVAEKYFSYEPKKKESVLKGLYGISDRFLHFWYKFIFPNSSALECEAAEQFYENYIENKLYEFVEQTYISVCKEFLVLMGQYGKLPGTFDQPESFYGKEGVIPIVLTGKDGKLLVAQCKWSAEPMTGTDFEDLLKRTEQLGQEADYYYLFSKEGFRSELSVVASGMDNIELIDLESL